MWQAGKLYKTYSQLLTESDLKTEARGFFPSQMVDIVVFPEGGIHGYLPLGRQTALLSSFEVPSGNDFIIPCDHKAYKEVCKMNLYENIFDRSIDKGHL